MTETRSTYKVASAPPPAATVKPPSREAWGLPSVDVLEELRMKAVHIVMTNGDNLQGWLIGYCRYHLTLKVGADGVLLVNKASMATLEPAPKVA